MAMWKQQSPSGSPTPWPEQPRPHTPAHVPAHNAATDQHDPSAAPSTRSANQQARPDQTIVTNGMTVRGEISGPDAIFVDGVVEGQINIPGERVTVGPNGMVAGTSKTPCITAREIVVLGVVRGNIIATDRLEIRANASVMGDVSTARLKIEDGSYFQGAIEIHENMAQPEARSEQESTQEGESFQGGTDFDGASSRRDFAGAAF